MLYFTTIKYLLTVFSSVTLGNYIIIRKTGAKNIILSTIILFLYFLYLSQFLYYFFRVFPLVVTDLFMWILISVIFNKSEGILNSILAGIIGFSIFFALNLLI